MRKALQGKAAGLWLLLIVVSATSASAERYLTIEEAQQICFAGADRFEAKVVRYTKEQKNAIEKASGEKVLIKGNRYWLAWSGTNLLGVLVVDHVLGKHEIIDYAVAINPAGSVRSVEVLEYRESHGYEIRGEKWREQFVGKTADSKLKLRDDIYNISGATISCRNVTDGVRRVLATYELVVRHDLPADAAARVQESQYDGER
jgi:Na+-translocating ferredoxin:NAD+ oxidoreductase RnfG subunit